MNDTDIDRNELLMVSAIITGGGIGGFHGGVASTSTIHTVQNNIKLIVNMAETLIREVNSRYK